MSDVEGLPPCPECGAGGPYTIHVDHRPGCRGARALDDLMDRDRAWFEAHPLDTEFTRDIEPADFAVPSFGAVELIGSVRVRLHGPGFRTREQGPLMMKAVPMDQLTLSDLYVIAHFRMINQAARARRRA